MLAQPYSPQLFRQGLLPGPPLLLDVLLKKMDYAQVKKKVGRYRQNNWAKENYQVEHFSIGVVFWLLPNILVNDLSDVHVVA